MLADEGESLKSSGYTEKIELEGDFSDHFQVYIILNSQIEVLTILTPDIMEILKALDKYEVELTNAGMLYVYCRGYITKKQSLLDLYKIIESVTVSIGRYALRQKQLHQNSS